MHCVEIEKNYHWTSLFVSKKFRRLVRFPSPDFLPDTSIKTESTVLQEKYYFHKQIILMTSLMFAWISFVFTVSHRGKISPRPWIADAHHWVFPQRAEFQLRAEYNDVTWKDSTVTSANWKRKYSRNTKLGRITRNELIWEGRDTKLLVLAKYK